MENFYADEKALCAEIERLCMSDPLAAQELIGTLIASASDEEKNDRRQSAALSRICCRFLLHRKNKSRLPAILSQDEPLRRALFGELNSYKYSLAFLLRRILKLDNPALTREVLLLLENNPYRDDSAKDYSERWSLSFVVREALRAPEDYLNLSDENRRLLEGLPLLETKE